VAGSLARYNAEIPEALWEELELSGCLRPVHA
jgi:hypothetical protein